MIKKLIKSFTIAITITVILSSVSLAAYGATIGIVNTSSTNYAMLGSNVTANVDYWASSGYISATGLDTDVYRGTATIPSMLCDDRIMLATPVNANSSQSLQLVTGETPKSNFDIVPGYAANTSVGYINTSDSANLEPGGNFSISIADAWVDTNNASNKYIVNKTDSYTVYVSPTVSGNITSTINGTFNVSPTSHVDESGNWATEANAYDKDTATVASTTNGAGTWSGNLTLSRAAYSTDTIRIYWGNAANIDDSYINAYYSGAWNLIGSGNVTANGWKTYAIGSTENVSSIRINVYRIGGSVPRVHELSFSTYYINPTITLTGISSGEGDIEVSYNGSDYYLQIGSSNTTLAVGQGTINDSANDITFMNYNALAYCDSIIYEVGGVQQLYYAPVTIPTVTTNTVTLVDRAGDATNNAGTLYLGQIPSGVDLTLGEFESDYSVETISVSTPTDIAPAVVVNVMPVSEAIKLADMQSKDPVLYPFFSAINSLTTPGIPIMMMYEVFFMALTMMVMFLFGRFGHLYLMVVGGLAVMGFATAWGIYDFALLIMLVLLGAGFIWMQGRQGA